MWFTTLRGYPASPKERRNALLIGAMTPLYDDLMDEKGMTHAEILTARNKSDQALCAVQHILDELQQNTLDTDLFLRILEQSGIAQDHSLRQQGRTKLTAEELIRITAEKGAAFTLIYRVILDHPLTVEEEKAIHTLGYLLQLTNDLFDVYKDLNNGQQTLMTLDDHLDLVQTEWEMHLNQFRKQWQALSYPTRAIRQSLVQIALLLGRGQVALDQLIDPVSRTDDRYCPQEYTRQQLICDMEKPSNFLASISWAKDWCSMNKFGT